MAEQAERVWKCGVCGLPVRPADASSTHPFYHRNPYTCISLLQDELATRLQLPADTLRQLAEIQQFLGATGVERTPVQLVRELIAEEHGRLYGRPLDGG